MSDTRDPRRDPTPGDEVIFGPQWQSELYAVIGRVNGNVQYQMGPMRAVLQCPLSQWREWARGAEIVRRAPATAPASSPQTSRDATETK